MSAAAQASFKKLGGKNKLKLGRKFNKNVNYVMIVMKPVI